MMVKGMVALLAASVSAVGPAAAAAPAHWVASWASANYEPETPNLLPTAPLGDATLREVIHLSAGGPRVRLHLSNLAGTQPWTVTGVHVARAAAPGRAAIVAGTDRAVTFSGSASVTVPAHSDYLSDPIDLPASAGADLAVSIRYTGAPSVQTGHPGSRATTYLVAGDHLADADLPAAQTAAHWFQLSSVDVEAPGSAIVAFGDSITDGHASTENGNDRWPDDLARRLQAGGRPVAVVNEGIGGNHMLTDGLGPNALSRLDHDLAHAGAKWVILLEGVNDLGMLSRSDDHTDAARTALVARLEGSFTQFVERAHALGLKVYGGTVTPYTGSDYYHPAAADEAARVALNAWIRAPGHFDGVVDFDRAVRDPAHPERLRADYDCGDHLHPSVAGYKAMADAIPLEPFR